MAPAKKRKKSRSAPRKRQTRTEKEPDYMIQISEPKLLRKDILESLREVIIFMQGYEQFTAIQTEKVALFEQLQGQLKEVDSLINGKLRKYFARGKLKPINPEAEHPQEEVEEESPGSPAPRLAARSLQKSTISDTNPLIDIPAPGDLDQLESQLKDIESQLKNIK